MAKKKTPNKKTENYNSAQKAVLLFKDERFRFVMSLFTFLFSIFIFIAFISFLFTWKNDQSRYYYGDRRH